MTDDYDYLPYTYMLTFLSGAIILVLRHDLGATLKLSLQLFVAHTRSLKHFAKPFLVRYLNVLFYYSHDGQSEPHSIQITCHYR